MLNANIKGDVSKWKTFVANRVTEIQCHVDPEKWNLVSTKDNPTDIISRGVELQKLKESEPWWQGPPWLITKEDWPVQRKIMEDTVDRIESHHTPISPYKN